MNISQRSVNKVIRKIHRSFLSVAKAIDGLAPVIASVSATRGATNGRGASTKSGRRRPRLTGVQRQALKLQGQYMGTMRGLKPRQQSRVKAVRREKGIRAAIAEARKLAAS